MSVTVCEARGNGKGGAKCDPVFLKFLLRFGGEGLWLVRLMVGLRASFHRSGGGGNTRGDVAFLKRGAHTCTKLSSREGQGVGWEAKYQ